MPRNWRWPRILAVVGLVAVVIGTIDPLEGSIVILLGTGLLALSAWLGGSRHRRLLYWAFALVAAGVGVMFGMSALGGLGGSTGRSIWWALLLVPYPVGWVMALVGAYRRIRDGTPSTLSSTT